MFGKSVMIPAACCPSDPSWFNAVTLFSWFSCRNTTSSNLGETSPRAGQGLTSCLLPIRLSLKLKLIKSDLFIRLLFIIPTYIKNEIQKY